MVQNDEVIRIDYVTYMRYLFVVASLFIEWNKEHNSIKFI